jgi:hypothetical protein
MCFNQSKECTIALWRWAYVFFYTRDLYFFLLNVLELFQCFHNHNYLFNSIGSFVSDVASCEIKRLGFFV